MTQETSQINPNHRFMGLSIHIFLHHPAVGVPPWPLSLGSGSEATVPCLTEEGQEFQALQGQAHGPNEALTRSMLRSAPFDVCFREKNNEAGNFREMEGI